MTDQHAAGLANRPSATGKSRIVALDGLRAVALLIIMGYHFGVGWLQGGFFSLDIFYVLSGYLITGLLLSEYRKRSAIKLSAFWLRRARRLLPALLIVLVAVTLMVRYAEPAGLYPEFRISALSALFYFSNWWQIVAQHNYFFATGAVYPLTHTWSLAVEEQFYLIWPLVVLAVMKLSGTFRRGLRNLLVVSAVGAVASAVEMAVLYGSGTKHTTRLYFGTDTHAQSILIGAVLACTLTTIQLRRGGEGMAPPATSAASRRWLTLLGVAGLAGTLALTITQKEPTGLAFRGGFALSALSAAAIILGSVCVTGGPMARVLSVSPLVWMGTVSYGAYLWHYPVFIYLDPARTGQTGLALLAIRFAVTFSLAAVSFYLVERPVMEGTFWRSLKAVGPAVVLMGVTVAVIVAGTVVPATAAVPPPPRHDPLSPTQRRALVSAHAFTTDPVRFALFGDSVALTLGVGLNVDSVPRYGVRVLDGTFLGCDLDDTEVELSGVVGPATPGCIGWRTVWPGLMARYHPEVTGLLLGRWEVSDHLYRGHWVHVGDPVWDRHLTAELDRAVDILSAGGAKVILFTFPYVDPPQQAANGSMFSEDEPSRMRAFNQLLSRVADSRKGVATLVDLNATLDPHGHYQAVVDGVTVRNSDGIHLTRAAGVWLQPVIMPTIDTLALAGRSA
jgi:peptidoglycan/LPS O-acetylase OafA/YrhL